MMGRVSGATGATHADRLSAAITKVNREKLIPAPTSKEKEIRVALALSQLGVSPKTRVEEAGPHVKDERAVRFETRRQIWEAAVSARGYSFNARLSCVHSHGLIKRRRP